MKKYIKPLSEFVEVNIEMTIANTSPNSKIEIEEGGGDEQLSNEYRGSWGNIWNN